MTKDNEQYAYLTIFGDFDPETITSWLGLAPTECWIKGSRNEKTHFERKFSRWSLNSRLDRSESLENHVRDVLKQTAERAEQIREIGKQYGTSMQLVGWFHSDYPGFGMDQEMIANLARLDVGFDCDFYYMYSHEREDS